MADPKKRLKRALAVAIVLSLLAVVWAFFQLRSGRGPLPQAVPQIASKAVMALSGVRQTATKDGTVQWKLDAVSAELEAGTGKMILQSPDILFFMEDGTEVRLTARRGILNTRSNDMEMQGNVSLQNDRYTLKTETLSYTHTKRVLVADKPVKIVGVAMQLQAANMIFDLKTNQAQFSGRVKGTVNDDFAL